jgi:hypothetical protein
MKPAIPGYWQKIARCYYDHYIFQINGEPVAAHPERHASWARNEATATERLRHWLRFRRGLLQMRYRYARAHGLIP